QGFAQGHAPSLLQEPHIGQVCYKDDPQAKTPASAILTLALLAALEFGGKHNKALALAKDLGLFTHVPSPSRFNRRLHALYPLL
ncbi:hypothetical protein ABTE22_19250, partial [Acinetobacter baumannii]